MERKYTSEIFAFYNKLIFNSLSSGQIALWHALIYLNNQHQWDEWFAVENAGLEIICGLSRSGIQKARNTLKQNSFIDFKPRGTKATLYKTFSLATVNSKQESNQVGTQERKQNSNPNSSQNKDTNNKYKYNSKFKEEIKKEKFDTEIFEKVIDYLNSKTGRKYKSDSERTRAFITARLKEGFTYSDFCKVIDNKVNDWLNDSYWSKFLRPETLFGNKFEGYLNEGETNDRSRKVYAGVESGKKAALGDVY